MSYLTTNHWLGIEDTMFETQMITLYNGLGMDESAHDGASELRNAGL